jgi:hypothetical protein
MARLTEAQVKKHNNKTTKFLVQKLRKLPPVILARLTNATVVAAVTNTYQDSGRFNWNWQVRWGSETKGGSGTEYGVSPVGLRGDERGTGHGAVIAKQKTIFGQGKLYQAIFDANPTHVTVFNPFYKGLYGEHAAEGKGGTAMKENVPAKIDAAVAREAARLQHEIKYKGIGE